LPFSESTIKATLKTLVEKGVILKTSKTKPEYTLPPNEMMDLRREAKLK
jgi:DNA-binding HxlR family transcriptional regulator